MHEYDLIAEWYARERDQLTGVPETVALASSIAPGACVLDIGCGNGVPITRTLLGAGHRVVGLDSSLEMLARFRVNCPGTPTILGKIDTCPLPSAFFDAAVAWGVMFHLVPRRQVLAIANVSRALKPSAPFLFTSGRFDEPQGFDQLEGKASTMNAVPFHYFSLSVDEYRSALGEHGLVLQDVHTDAGQNTYFLATKSR